MTDPATHAQQTDGASELEGRLAARADHFHDYVARKIPPKLRREVCPEDVLQEVWTAAFRGYAGFTERGRDAFDRWLMSITQRKLIDAIRRVHTLKRGRGHHIMHEAQRLSTTYLDLFATAVDTRRTPSSEDAAKEAVTAVKAALSELPEDHRCAIIMHHIEGKSQAEVAEAMARTRPAVNSLLFRGIRMMREQLQPAGRFFSDGS